MLILKPDWTSLEPQPQPTVHRNPSGVACSGSISAFLQGLNPIRFYGSEITNYENGCGYWSSVGDGIQGAIVAVMATADMSLDEVVGHAVSSIELIGLVRINFGRDRNMQLCIESRCEITDKDGMVVSVRFSPATEPSPVGLDALGALYNQTVTSAVAAGDGSLRIAFKNGSVLNLPVDPYYEAGHFVLPDRYVVVPPAGRRPIAGAE
jgi:hypothetical protein